MVKVMLYIYLIIKSYTIYVALKTGKMGPLVKVLSALPNYLNSIPGTHTMEGEN